VPEPLPADGVVSAPARRGPSGDRIREWVGANAIILVLVALIVGIAIIDSGFVSLTNLRNILLNSSTRLIIALGAGIVLISRGVDLSAGRMVGLAAVVSASMLQVEDYGRLFFPDLVPLPLFAPLVIAISLCVFFGAINGIVIAKLHVPPFIATLGMMVIIYGINAIYFDQTPNNSQPIGGLRDDFTALGTGAVGEGPLSIPYIVIIAALTAVVFWILLNKTVFGKNVYAIGGNPQAAAVSGIDIAKNIIAVYALAGATYGLAGVLEAARTGGANSSYGSLYELDAIAACVVGGVSTAGGIGRVGGITVGVLVFGVINYGLTFIGINPFWQQIIKGVIIIGAVAFDIARNWRQR